MVNNYVKHIIYILSSLCSLKGTFTIQISQTDIVTQSG